MREKVIMCFGDSNTYGYNPETGGRFSFTERWTNQLQDKLGDNYHIIEEGLNGRTTVFDDPIEGDKNGKNHLPICINTHSPIDLIIIMLGTNDFKPRFHASVDDITKGMEVLLMMIKATLPNPFTKIPDILLVAPPPFRDILSKDMAAIFGNGQLRNRSFSLARNYENLASTYNVHFLKADDISSGLDGLHISKEGQSIHAQALYNKIVEIGL